MARRDFIPLLLAGVVFAAAADVSALQSETPAATPCQNAGTGQASSSDDAASKKTKKKDDQPAPSTDVPCAPAAKEPSTAEKFPFPGSSSAPALPGSPAPAPDAPVPSGHHPSAAEEHPFPGSAPPMPGSDASSSSSSSSSNDGSSSSNDGSAAGDAPATPEKTDAPRNLGRRHLPKVEKLQSDEDRADEDLKIAKFYEDKGNLNAAYLRVQDAVKSLPSDSETHYALARIAHKLNKRDEAIAEYNAYLKMEPDGENIKQARKALDQLQSK